MTREKYIDKLDKLKKYFYYEDRLDEIGFHIWERDEVSDIVNDYIELIAESIGDTYNEDDINDESWTAYFVYDCQFGKYSDTYTVEVDNKKIKLNNAGDVYDLVKGKI